MKKQNLLIGLTLLFAVLLALGGADAQVSSEFDRVCGLAKDEMLARTDGPAQQSQAPALSTPKAPPLVQYTVIELGGRRAIDLAESGEIVGSKSSTPERFHAAYWTGSQSLPIDLGTLPGLNSAATALNPR